MDIPRYEGVQGRKNVAAITAALEEAGAAIIQAPDPTVAPFVYVLRAANGERLEVVCYAFTANEYRQGGRPAGEHRFQVKYGSDFKRAHDLYLDPTRRRVTLMFGVHHELALFVAVDPRMHSPTWFSMSIEMKEHDLLRAKSGGWHVWERERSNVRRRLERPLENLQTESVLAFVPRHFMRYVAFERLASGVDTGERMLLAERLVGLGLADRAGSATASSAAAPHPLEALLGLSATEILDVLNDSFRLLVAVRGNVAEHHLKTILLAAPGVSDVERLDKDGEPDFRLRYRRRTFRIECKNVLRKLLKDGVPRVDFQKTRATPGNRCSRYYDARQFELLAACLHPVRETWEYRFCPTVALPPHPSCPGRLSSKVAVAGDAWSDSIVESLDRLLVGR